jgi:hypothetical protein
MDSGPTRKTQSLGEIAVAVAVAATPVHETDRQTKRFYISRVFLSFVNIQLQYIDSIASISIVQPRTVRIQQALVKVCGLMEYGLKCPVLTFKCLRFRQPKFWEFDIYFSLKG